jgi:acetyl-CoA decarbonylase/synthase complex subunit beta
MPEYCNAAYVNEAFEAAGTSGSENTCFLLKKSAHAQARPEIVISDGVKDHISVLVEVSDENLSPELEEIVEQAALKSVNYIHGVRAYEKKYRLFLETSDDTFEPEKIGEAVMKGIRLQYPRLEDIRVSILPGSEESFNHAKKYKTKRAEYIAAMDEDNTGDFTVCVECRPFSLEHTCVVTPGRPPMCASRTYASIKAAGLFGSIVTPYQRPSEQDLPIRSVYQKGRAVDAQRGEYEGCNKVYDEFTRGKLKKVYLHSLRGHPHTSCGCFQNLAFWIEEVQGIGIMSRGSKAVAPDGSTWDMLANRAGGKQSDGITGVSTAYVQSKYFLRGDGGLANVVWTDSKLYDKLREFLPAAQKVATENNAASIEELKLFVERE